MTALRITWVYEPHDSPRFHLGPDHELVEEIGRRAGVTVPMIEGALHEVAPEEGFILLSSFSPHQAIGACSPDKQAELAARIIPIDVSASRIFERVLEGLSVPAAIDSASHLKWKQSDRTQQGASGPYGLRRIGSLIGASCIASHLVHGGLPASPDESPRYCYLTSATHFGLPHLLADYLSALHEERSAGLDRG